MLFWWLLYESWDVEGLIITVTVICILVRPGTKSPVTLPLVSTAAKNKLAMTRFRTNLKIIFSNDQEHSIEYFNLLLVVLNPLLLTKMRMMIELRMLPTRQLTRVRISSIMRGQARSGPESPPPSSPRASAAEVFDNMVFWKRVD